MLTESRSGRCDFDGCNRSYSFRYRLANHYFFCNKEHLEMFHVKLSQDINSALATAKIIEASYGSTED